MAAAAVRAHTAGTSVASGTTVTWSVSASNAVTAGNLIAVLVGMSNTGTSTPVVNSISVPAGETAAWSKVASFDSPSAVAGSGARGELWVIRTTIAWPVATVITVTLSAAVVTKIAIPEEFSGARTDLRSTSAGNSAVSAPVSAATTGTAPQIDDLVLGGIVVVSSAAPTPDADSLNGAWNAGDTAVASSFAGRLQWKIPTAAGQQTFDKTDATVGGCAVACLLQDLGMRAAITRVAAVQRAAGY